MSDISKFVLEIEGGNEGVQTDADIAAFLNIVAAKLCAGYPSDIIVDVNGNTVGSYATKRIEETV
jgi:hypothetical protein